MKKIWLLCFLLVGTLWSSAQKIDLSDFKGIVARNIGPAGMSGRVTSIDVSLNGPEVIYIGTASGGVWKSESGGIEWTPIFEEERVQSIGAVAVNPQNPSEIWVGTGEGNPRNSHNSGLGIYKSLDGGQTWQHLGLEKTRLIHRIIIHRDDPNTVYVAALGSAWGPNSERGVYKTTDGGQNWEKVLYVNEDTGVADLIVDPRNPNKLFAAMWEFGRKPWTFNSGGPHSGIYRTYDGGKNWTRISDEDGLPKGDLGRVGLAIAPSKPDVVYALVESKELALYRSDDGGHKWKKRGSGDNVGNRPFYYADIFVDPQNENRIYSLWSVVSRSEDGGKTFEVIIPYRGVHPDHHALWIHPDNPNYLIEGNDGGLNISHDGGKHWRFVENLPLAQFYHINHDMDIPYNVMGGMQDNGSWVGPSAVWKYGGIRNYDWQEVAFGDGFDVVARPDDNRFGYAMSQGGYLSYYDRLTGDNKFIRPVHPEGQTLRFNWNAAIAQDPFDNCGVYYGSQFVHYSRDCGQSWSILSPDLTTNDTTKQKQALSGGLTIDATQAENYTTILAIAPSPHDEKVIWVGTDDGNLQLTRDGGQSWTNLADRLPACPPGSWIPQIEVSPTNAGEAFVVVNNYRRNDWEPYAYHSKDYGQTWTRIVDGDKVSGYAQSIVQDPEEGKLLFLGTDHGLYFTIDGGKEWNKWDNKFPSVSTTDLKIHPREHDLVIGTFGRAAYILDDIRPFRELARTEGKILDADFAAFPAPDAYLNSYTSVSGTRFMADGDFAGTNRPRGALLTLWVKDQEDEKEGSDTGAEEVEPQAAKRGAKTKQKKNKKDTAAAEAPTEEGAKGEKAKKKKKGGDKVVVRVRNLAGDTLYTFRKKLKTGMNRITWGLSRKGVRFPSRRKIKPDADDPWGPSVSPGTYELHFTYGDWTDSTRVEVRPDPRESYNPQQQAQRDTALADFFRLVDKASEGFNRLQEARKTVKLVDQQMVHAVDSTKKQIADLGKAMVDSIDTIMEVYTFPEDAKGIDSVTPTLNRSLYRASSFLYDAPGEPGQNAQHAVALARDGVEEVLAQINRFFATDWEAYQEAVEAVEAPLFESYEAIQLE
ncbi:MAG: hypothetical protein AAF146_18315 [Bacteroidota bacterium]